MERYYNGENFAYEGQKLLMSEGHTIWNITHEKLLEHNYFPIVKGKKPKYNAETQYLIEEEMKLINKQYVIQYKVMKYTKEELETLKEV